MIERISPGNMVKVTARVTCAGACPAASFWARPPSQYERAAADPGAGQPVQRDVVEDVVPGEIARGLAVEKRAEIRAREREAIRQLA